MHPALSGANLHRCLKNGESGDVVIGQGCGALEDSYVLQAEVVAIQAALLWLISNPCNLKDTNVKLLTDSQSTLQSIFSLKPTSKLVEETIKLLVLAKLK